LNYKNVKYKFRQQISAAAHVERQQKHSISATVQRSEVSRIKVWCMQQQLNPQSLKHSSYYTITSHSLHAI